MARVCTVASHLPVEEMDQRIKSVKAGVACPALDDYSAGAGGAATGGGIGRPLWGEAPDGA